VPLAASDAAIEQLIRDEVARVAPAHDAARAPQDGRSSEIWISVFLDGMDTNSVAYAFGIARPGRPLLIQRRESLQTYR
jgi:hypothetical protein